MPSKIKVNSIVNLNGDSAPELTYGATIPSGYTLAVNGNYNSSGVATVGFLTASNVTAGVITATSFVGDGSGLTNTSSLSISKAIALKYILADPPLRS